MKPGHAIVGAARGNKMPQKKRLVGASTPPAAEASETRGGFFWGPFNRDREQDAIHNGLRSGRVRQGLPCGPPG